MSCKRCTKEDELQAVYENHELQAEYDENELKVQEIHEKNQ